MVSLVHMPPWVLKELSSLAFFFFWSGKRDLVSRSVVVQPSLLGGFSVVDVKLKVWALLGQWVRRFASSSSGWVSFMSFWFNFHFGASPHVVFSWPYSYDPRVLPPFYRSLLLAWRGLDGSFSVSRDALVYGASSDHVCSLMSISSTKACYLFLLSESMVSPHCVEKFAGVYDALDWPATWCSLFFFDLDRQVIDLTWKIAHGVLYTAQHLGSFGLPVPLSCFCGAPVESLEHLFFLCPLAQSILSWLQSLLFAFSPMCPVILCRHVLFGFNSDELPVTPGIFVYLLNLVKFLIWHSWNDLGLVVSILALPRSSRRLKCMRGSIFQSFLSTLGPLAAVGTFIDSGVLVVSLRLLWMAVVWLIFSLCFCCLCLDLFYGCFCIV